MSYTVENTRCYVGLSPEEWQREYDNVQRQIRAIRGGVSIHTDSSLLPSAVLSILEENRP